MDGEDAGAESAYAQRPDGLRRLRACISCKLIKTEDQFKASACDNCPKPERRNKHYLEEWTETNTTDDYEGMVAMMQPESSWVGRWLQMHTVDDAGVRRPLKPGLYAIKLPEVEAAAAGAGDGEGGADDDYEEEEEEEAGSGAGAGAGAGSGSSSGAAGSSSSSGGAAAPDRSDPAVRDAAVAAATLDED